MIKENDKKNPILMQGAMDGETAYLISKLENKRIESYGNLNFYIGTVEDYPVVISKTNIGIINCAEATTIGILKYNPKIIINQGTAGGHGNNIHKNDIVIATDCINITSFDTVKKQKGEGSNVDNWKLNDFSRKDEGKISESLLNEEGSNISYEFDEKLIKKAVQYENEYKKGKIYVGRIASGDIWNKEIDRIIYLNFKYKTLCEEMESIAVLKVAKSFNIPVLEIRIISNNEIFNEKFEMKSGAYCQEFVEKICRGLCKEYK